MSFYDMHEKILQIIAAFSVYMIVLTKTCVALLLSIIRNKFKNFRVLW